MNSRASAVELAAKRAHTKNHTVKDISTDEFAIQVFNQATIEKRLPREAYMNILNAQKGTETIKPEFADAIAIAMREWAVENGATHYTHWFQPLTGASAEKHESFIDWKTQDVGIEKFSGRELVQGEPDASSFPSGGLRTTYEARGYTGWDPSSPVFLWEAGDGMTLCIPSVFFSWTGDVLDNKIPLLRSDHMINQAALRLLRLTGSKATQVYSTLGWEQEYFVVDRALRDLRPDLLTLGTTVYGAPPPKGQELQDHYFGTVKDRVLAYMRDVENASLKLGIPVKTRHNEVAPAQHELAPVFEKASLAVDHNILLMELMRRIAIKHDLALLFHEKPFHDLNGSGKHNNWSLATDSGLNLLDPTDFPEKSTQFLILLTAIVHAFHRHSRLLRASIASAGNDKRLGGHEAPPAIISVYLGQQLEDLLNSLENDDEDFTSSKADMVDLGHLTLPEMSKDLTDRNRTSPFAFTGNKFEFRAVGSAQSCALPITAINVIVSESLNQILDEIEKLCASDTQPTPDQLANAAKPVLKRFLKESKAVRYAGDNYSKEWVAEAEKRGLANIPKSFDAFKALKDNAVVHAFKDVLTKDELSARHDILVEQYANLMNIESNLMLDIFRTQIFPAALEHQKKMAKSIKLASEVGGCDCKTLERSLRDFTELLQQCMNEVDKLEEFQTEAMAFDNLDKTAHFFAHTVNSQMGLTRELVDQLEMLIEDRLWPLPKYRELLFLI
ncbi:Type-3 glutamine synthetase [Chlamydiales bacterium SCGC AG-110-M15]|nr:Type-3 glutamine synthetase [Chlamydiales bacterium SCGC AG-110-M15]